jgi:7-keto-8-aminopelargonate synthetase-like enzyme
MQVMPVPEEPVSEEQARHLANVRLAALEETFRRHDSNYPNLLRAQRLLRNVVECRARRGVSQAAVAGARGTSQPVIARIEHRVAHGSGADVLLSTLESYAQSLDLRVALVDQTGQVVVDDENPSWDA